MKKSSFVSAVLACLFVSGSVCASDIDSSLLPEGVTVEQIEQHLTSNNGVFDLVGDELTQFESAKVKTLRKCGRFELNCYGNVIELIVYKNETRTDLQCPLGIAYPNRRPPSVIIRDCKTYYNDKVGWAYDAQVNITSAVEIPNAKYETKKSKFQQ